MSSDCSSIPDAKFFNEKYTYPTWFTRKKMIFHQKMLRRLKKLRFLHSRSSQYYESMNMKLSTPSIVITALSGIASFLSTSQYVDQDGQNACGITVGVLASVASVFQAFAAACAYGAKKEAHRTVAEQYNALIVKTKFEMEMPNEEDFIDNLEKSILEIDSKCNYFVPQFIIKEWEDSQSQSLAPTHTPQKNSDNSDSMNIGLFEEENNIGLKNSEYLQVPSNVKLDIVNKGNLPSEKSYLLENRSVSNSHIQKSLAGANETTLRDNLVNISIPENQQVTYKNVKNLDDITETKVISNANPSISNANPSISNANPSISNANPSINDIVINIEESDEYENKTQEIDLISDTIQNTESTDSNV